MSLSRFSAQPSHSTLPFGLYVWVWKTWTKRHQYLETRLFHCQRMGYWLGPSLSAYLNKLNKTSVKKNELSPFPLGYHTMFRHSLACCTLPSLRPCQKEPAWKPHYSVNGSNLTLSVTWAQHKKNPPIHPLLLRIPIPFHDVAYGSLRINASLDLPMTVGCSNPPSTRIEHTNIIRINTALLSFTRL